jgi:manganese oxidase
MMATSANRSRCGRARALLLCAACVVTVIDAHAADAAPACNRIVTASVVAIEQLYTYNRFGAYNPAGMMYALRRDVVASQDIVSAGLSLKEGDAIPAQPDERKDVLLAGKVRLRDDKRPRPLVLRANEQDCLEVTFTNLLSPTLNGQEILKDPETGQSIPLDSEEPSTRHASMHVNGLDYVVMPGQPKMSTQTLTDAAGTHKRAHLAADGANVGRNLSSLAAPGQTRIYQWYAKQEGGYLFHSMAAAAGGEGDGGQLGLGLFGAVNVQPKGAKWYRSQTDAVDLQRATVGRNPAPFGGTPKIDYEAKRDDGTPLLNMLQAKGGKTFEIVHTDLNAVIDVSAQDEHCKTANRPGHTGHGPGAACGKPYREFTTIFHDEITAVQAFRELADEGNPIASIKDGMGINYGVGGMGAPVLANRKKTGPAAKCAECKFEEFFLSSWANGDPAMVVEKDAATGKATKALYPDDPSNVHHSYMGDAVRFRNMHAGPKETHVFHLHAHQWVQDKHDPDSVYLDSQTISPGAVFSYEIHYGGSGNRNFTPGDSIFHCHLYPHFAQGMWELWRTHDVFEAGTPDRNLPDGEIAGGTPNPAIVPLPRTAMPHMPSDQFKGYPFYVAGQSGHRPPQPPLDFDKDNETDDTKSDGGLRRHVVLDATTVDGVAAVERKYTDPNLVGNELNKASVQNAKRVTSQNRDTNLLAFAKRLDSARIQLLNPEGEPSEQDAMKFHAGALSSSVATTTDYQWPGRGYPSCDSKGNCFATQRDMVFHVNGKAPKPGAPYADPCRADAVDRTYHAAYLQFDMPVNKAGWHDPQARIAVLENDVADTLNYTRPAEPLFFRANSGECITFAATNLIPSNLNVDDFQIFSPTDVIGQHIHLVKFDVTSSDGSGNGWNYEDGTLSADEVRERILANNKYQQSVGGSQFLLPKRHRMFREGPMAGDARGQCPTNLAQVTAEELEKHPWCGAQTTVQRWWADPLLNNKGKDRTLRTVFTHDHFGPSSHQHHGLYAALVVEPKDSVWTTLDGKQIIGGSRADGAGKAVPIPCRADGGPTSYAANVLLQPGAQQIAACGDTQRLFAAKGNEDRREFALAFADFAILYDKDDKPINPPNRLERDLPMSVDHLPIPFPEGISGGDPGGQLLNYRNEPIPLRIAKTENAPGQPLTEFSRGRRGVGGLPTPLVEQKDGAAGDPAHVFSSALHEAPAQMPASIAAGSAGNADKMLFTELPKGTALTGGDRRPALRGLGDPATPLLLAYEGDKVQLRLIQGAQEENHVFTMHGVKWLSQPGSPSSGWMNAQHIGISEHFEFEINVDSASPQQPTDYLYYSSATDNLWDGQWGLLRAFKSVNHAGATTPLEQPGLKPLPSNPLGVSSSTPDQKPCPAGAPTAKRDVAAWRARDLLPGRKLVYNERFKLDDPNAIIFVRAEDEAAYRDGSKQPEPLVLRANAGDCITINLFNRIAYDTVDGPLPFDGPEQALSPEQLAKNQQARSSWSYNMIPPIVRGFNFNQVRMSRNVALHPQLVAVNTSASDGAHVGNNKDSTAKPCTDCRHALNVLGAGGLSELVFKPAAQGGLPHLAPTQYVWYAGHFSKDGKAAPVELGAIALRDMADVVKHASHGAIGSLVIEPQCSAWDADKGKNASATVTYWQPKKIGNATRCGPQPVDAKRFREFVLMYQDDLSLQQNGSAMGNLRNGDDAEDSGQKAFNYRTEPLWARLGADPGSSPDEMANYDFSNALSSMAHGDPATPIFTAKAGTPVRFRVVHPGGHPRNHAFSVAGHDWIINPWTCPLAPKPGDCESNTLGWNKFSANRIGTAGGIGPARHLNILTRAGGAFEVPGDYLYRTQEGFMFGGGLWGIFRVEP